MTAADSGRAGCGDGDHAVAFVAVDQGDRLAVAAEQAACVDVDQLQNLGIELDLQRHGVDVVRVGEQDGCWKVLPTACVELGGATLSDDGLDHAAPGRRGSRSCRGGAAMSPDLPGLGGMACCFSCWAMAPAAMSAAEVFGARSRSRRLCGKSLSMGRIGVAQFDGGLRAGVDGAGVEGGEHGLADDVRDEDEDDLVLLVLVVDGPEEVLEQRNLREAGGAAVGDVVLFGEDAGEQAGFAVAQLDDGLNPRAVR